MVTITDKSACCGCAACVQVCPMQCIIFGEDVEGFKYPKVLESKCVHCGLCENVCPIINKEDTKLPLKIYAAKNKDTQVRVKSSSGGVFALLAIETINRGGVVFGARYNEKWEVEHDFCDTLEGVPAFQGSKYMQSAIGKTYHQAEEFLKIGRKVLFSGTPCQIAGLKSYIRKDYDNLLTVDVVCHGVPSPLVWRDYLREISGGREVTDVNFRSKSTSWKIYDVVVEGKSENILRQPFNENLYMKGFLSDIYLRPSCYACPFKTGRSGTDITLGDFWGIQSSMPDFDDDQGVSIVLIQTNKAIQIVDALDVEKREVSYDCVLKGNPSIEQCAHYNKRYIRKYWRIPNRTKAIKIVLSKMSPNIIRKCANGLMRFIMGWI